MVRDVEEMFGSVLLCRSNRQETGYLPGLVRRILLCLGAGVHTAQAVAAGMVNVPAAVTGAVIGTGIVGLNYTHAEAKKIGVKRARVLHRVFCAMTGLGIAAHVIGVKRPRR